MHLKNFSLIKLPGQGFVLSPAYDLVATALVNPADKEDLALTLNGKKKKITRNDFIAAFRTLNLARHLLSGRSSTLTPIHNHWKT